MINPGIYSGLSYADWKEEQKKVKATQKKEAFRKFVESVKGSAIYCSRKFHRGYCPRYWTDTRGIVRRIGEIVAAGVAFGIIICGLNMFALIF